MKKSILTITALILAAGVVMAQEKNTTITVSKTEQTVKEEAGRTVETSTTATEIEHENTVIVNDFDKNWEFSLGLGTQTYLGEYSGTHQKFLDLWTGPAIDLGIQKWTSPYFAVGLGINLSPYRGLYSAGDDKATFRQDGDPLYKDKNGGESLYLAGSKLNRWYGDFFVTFSFDILNICSGYRSDRMYHLIGYLGGGVAVALNSSVYTSCTGSFNAGLINQFNINDRWSLNINVRGALYGDALNGISYVSSGDKKNIPLDGMIGLTGGFSYKFGFVNKKSALTGAETVAAWIPLTTAVLASQEYADAVKDGDVAKEVAKEYAEQANKTADELAQAKKTIADQEEALAAAKVVNYRQIINFPIDKWKLNNREKVAIMLAAEAIKAAPNTKFAVTGYADMQTAYPKYNDKLSANRAEAVRKALVDEFGVNPDQLVIDHKGGVDYMYYNDPQCSRSVIIEAIR